MRNGTGYVGALKCVNVKDARTQIIQFKILHSFKYQTGYLIVREIQL